MMKIRCNGCVFLAAFAAAAVVNTLPAEVFTLAKVPVSMADWQNASFYTGGAAPTGADTDVIEIPNGMVVTVKDSDVAILEFLYGIDSVKLLGDSNPDSPCARFVIDVAEGKTVEYAGRLDDQTSNGVYSHVEKKGLGTLKLMRSADNDYHVRWHVTAGELWLPPVPETLVNCYKYYGQMWIGENGVLRTDCCTNRVHDGKTCYGVFQMSGLYNQGVVTNGSSGTTTIYLTYSWLESPCSSSGRFGGGLSFNIRGGDIDFSGRDNTFGVITAETNTERYGGRIATVGVRYFGNKDNKPSSVGVSTGDAVIMRGAPSVRIVYTGLGETTDKNFRCIAGSAEKVGWNVLDGGTNGGLRIVGELSKYDTSTYWIPHIEFSGDHVNACSFSGKCEDFTFGYSPETYKGRRYNRYIKKSGKGEWIFEDSGKFKNSGVLEVEDGTLSFASLKQVGQLCSLGYSSNLFASEATQPEESQRVPYAFLLGSRSDSGCKGMMKYTGSIGAICGTRPFALNGTGGVMADEGAGVLKLSGFYGNGTGSRTLVLGGTSVKDNYARDITNGTAVVSVRKEGSGKWIIGGELGFSGNLEVLEGTLVVSVPDVDRYRRYRLVVKEIGSNNAGFRELHGASWTGISEYVNISEIGLFTEDGTRVNLGLAGCADAAELAPGQAAVGDNRTILGTYNATDALDICNLFDNRRQSPTGGAWNGVVWKFDGTGPVLSDPSTHVAIDMYLPESAGNVARYDVSASYYVTQTSGGTIPTAFALYGSVDGVKWDLLSNETDSIAVMPAGSYRWLCTNTQFADDETTKRTGNWLLKKTVPDAPEGRTLNGISGVKIAGGAKLLYEGPAQNAPVISNLTVDSVSGGTIDGFGFADAGEIEVENLQMDSNRVRLPLTIVGDDADVLENWILTVDGKISAKLKLHVSGEDVCVIKRGLVLSVR